jgi:N-acetyl-alpha-D-muramate 1-phosphate uridylyltransferase
VTLPVAILAGGLATRLKPISEKIPKALVDVAGRPFVAWQLEQLCEQGFRRVVLCIGYLGEQIRDVVGDGARFGVAVSYSQDWPDLLGTGGALRKALPLLDSQFVVLYGDSYLPIDFGPVEQSFLRSGKPALMTVQRNSDRWDKSNVLFADGVIVEYNKGAPRSEMKYIDYGLGVVSADILMGHGEGEAFDLGDVYHDLSIEGRLAGYEVRERFYEIGSHQGLAEATQYFRDKDLRGRGE